MCIVHATFPSHVDAHIFADEVVKRLAGKDYAMPLPDPAGPKPFTRVWNALRWWAWWKVDKWAYRIERLLRPKE